MSNLLLTAMARLRVRLSAGGTPQFTLPTGITYNQVTRQFDGTVLDTTYDLPVGGTKHTPADAAAFQTALTNSVRGDVIVLTAGVNYDTASGFSVPAKAGSGWIYIISSTVDAATFTVPVGTRATSAHAAEMPSIRATSTANALRWADNSTCSHWRLVGIRVAVDSANTGVIGQLVNIGTVGGQTTTADQPTDIVWDRCLVDAARGLGSYNTQVGIAVNCGRFAFIDGSVLGVSHTGSDAQAIHIKQTPGPVKLVNAHLEASGENVMSGGFGFTITNQESQDVEIRRCRFSKPVEWNSLDVSYDGVNRVVKNLFEMKSGKRYLVTGCVFEQCWVDGQSGLAINIKTGGQDNAWTGTSDVTIWYNIVRNCGRVFSLVGVDSPVGPGTAATRIEVAHLLAYDISIDLYPGATNTGYFQCTASVGQNTIRNMTIGRVGATTVPGTGLALGDSPDTTTGAWNLTNNIFPRGSFGWGVISPSSGGEGTPSLNRWAASGYTMSGNLLVGTAQGTYPANNQNVANMAAVQFVGGDDFNLLGASPAVGYATDGGNSGADIATVTSATSGVA